MIQFKKGQFFEDEANGDLLKILGFSDEVTSESVIDDEFVSTTPYCRCMCITPDGTYFGIQEMKVAHLYRERFKQVGGIREIWLKWKHRKVRLAK